MRVDSRRGGKTHGLAYVTHGWRIAVLGRVFADEVEYLLLTLSQIHVCAAPVSDGLSPETNMCSYSSAGSGRNQGRAVQGGVDGYTRPLCARGGIGRRARLRALWTAWSVVVRVHSGAWRKPWKSGLFLVKGSSVARERYCSVLGQWPSRTICRTFCVPDVRQDEPHDLRRQEPSQASQDHPLVPLARR